VARREGLLPLGINLAVIEYTLAPAARLDRIVAEVRRAGRWLAEHLADYGADPSRLYVSGHSAGGHLTAMTMPLPEVRGLTRTFAEADEEEIVQFGPIPEGISATCFTFVIAIATGYGLHSPLAVHTAMN
jgi:hypothetical protein